MAALGSTAGSSVTSTTSSAWIAHRSGRRSRGRPAARARSASRRTPRSGHPPLQRVFLEAHVRRRYPWRAGRNRASSRSMFGRSSPRRGTAAPASRCSARCSATSPMRQRPAAMPTRRRRSAARSAARRSSRSPTNTASARPRRAADEPVAPVGQVQRERGRRRAARRARAVDGAAASVPMISMPATKTGIASASAGRGEPRPRAGSPSTRRPTASSSVAAAPTPAAFMRRRPARAPEQDEQHDERRRRRQRRARRRRRDDQHRRDARRRRRARSRRRGSPAGSFGTRK